MASLYRRPRSPYFWLRCKDSSGKWTSRNTRTKDRDEAEAICDSLRTTEDLASKGKLTPELVSELLTDTLIRTGVKYEPSVPIPTILGQVYLPNSGCFSYMLQSGDFLKIGKTTRLRKRIATYRAHNPDHKLLAVRSFEGVQELAEFETRIHKEFSIHAKEDETEWFKDTPKIRKAFSAPAADSQLIYLNFF
jgi:T5orf172 domain